VSLALVWTAGLAGAVHAGFSLYWALGGRRLLATVGQWAVDLSTDRPLAAGIVRTGGGGQASWHDDPSGRCLWTSALAVVVARLSWAGGLLLVAYGGINTIVALAVLAGVIRPEGGYDADAMRGHAYLWDPLFFLWGGALLLSLWLRQTLRAVR